MVYGLAFFSSFSAGAFCFFFGLSTIHTAEWARCTYDTLLARLISFHLQHSIVIPTCDYLRHVVRVAGFVLVSSVIDLAPAFGSRFKCILIGSERPIQKESQASLIVLLLLIAHFANKVGIVLAIIEAVSFPIAHGTLEWLSIWRVRVALIAHELAHGSPVIALAPVLLNAQCTFVSLRAAGVERAIRSVAVYEDVIDRDHAARLALKEPGNHCIAIAAERIIHDILTAECAVRHCRNLCLLRPACVPALGTVRRRRALRGSRGSS